MNFEEDFKIIKNLTEIQGCSGNEGKIREYIKKIITPYCSKVEIDSIGNLFGFINGEKIGDTKTKLNILLDAHADEIGFMVRFIDKKGFIRFSQVGGQNPRILPGQIVTVHSSSGQDIIGIIGEKPLHLLKQEERKKTSKIEDLFIDIGTKDEQECKELVSVGDYITFKQECSRLIKNQRIFAKSFDDRAGCFVLMKLIMEISQISDKLPHNLIFLFSSQEEIGTRGATVGSYKISPDIGLAVEVNHAIDFPGIDKEKYFECSLGSGVAIRVGPNMHSKLSKTLIDLAKKENIPFTLRAEPSITPTNARVIQMTKSGVPCALVGVPLRYMHTNVETIQYSDIIHTVDLLKSFLLSDLTGVLIL